MVALVEVQIFHNATRSGETVFQVQKEDKNEAIQAIDSWIKTYFNIHVTWSNDQQYKATTYRLDPKSRTLASQLTAIAQETTHGQRKPIAQNPRPKPTPKPPATNAWIDLTRVREPPLEFPGKTFEKRNLEEEGTVTTLSESTWHSSSRTTQETSEKFKKVGSNLRNLSYRHKKLEAGLECLEMSAGIKTNQLFRCFELHHNRLEGWRPLVKGMLQSTFSTFN